MREHIVRGIIGDKAPEGIRKVDGLATLLETVQTFAELFDIPHDWLRQFANRVWGEEAVHGFSADTVKLCGFGRQSALGRVQKSIVPGVFAKLIGNVVYLVEEVWISYVDF